jgi:ABC-type transport system involved in cytochrome c biogenesis permease subunit
MSSGASAKTSDFDSKALSGTHAGVSPGALLFNGLSGLASLKLTVVLFGLSILLVLFGTLAQDKVGIWDVMSGYFRSFFVWVPFNLLPQKWAPDFQNIPGGFWFLGGRSLGLLLALNLVSAHLVRFRVQAKGERLWLGWIVFALGLLLCGVIIAYGNLKDGVQDRPWFDWAVLWWAIVGGTSLLSIICAGFAFKSFQGRLLPQLLAMVASIGLLVLVIGLAVTGNRLDDAALRILWQLIQGTIGGLVLLAGCMMVFKKRGGIVLLHLGIGLLLYNELFVSVTNVEEQITLAEGEESNLARDTRYVELAIVDRSDSKMDKVLAIPASQFRSARKDHAVTLDLKDLPFDLRVDRFMKNSAIERIAPMFPQDEDLPKVTQGIGLDNTAVPLPPVAGAESGNQSDVASAYVTVLKKGTAEPVTTMLLPQEDFFNGVAHPIEVDGEKYYLSLRFKQTPKPYTVQLLDVERVNYVGTSVPKEFWSDFVIHNEDQSTSIQSHISMNEPLRYSGETFYQSGYFKHPDGREQTTLQVVTNAGWMMPYVACMLVAIGMLAHFSVTLVQILGKTVQSAKQATGDAVVEAEVSGAKGVEVSMPGRATGPGWLPAIVVIAIALLYVLSSFRPPADVRDFELAKAGRLPVTSGGRVMPMDSLARNTLRQLQKKETVAHGTGKKVSSMQWLMDVITRSEVGPQYRVFKVQNLELLSAIELKRRSGFLYSYTELEPHRSEIEKNAQEASRKQQNRRERISKLDEAFLDLMAKMRTYEALVEINRLPEQSAGNIDFRQLMNMVLIAARTTQEGQSLPLMVPTPQSDRKWETLTYHEVRREVYKLAQAQSMQAGTEGEPLKIDDVARRWAEHLIKDELYSMGAVSLVTLQERDRLVSEGKSEADIDAALRDYVRGQELDQLIGMATLDLYQQAEMRLLQEKGMAGDALQEELTRQLLQRDFDMAVLRKVQDQLSRLGSSAEGFADLIQSSLEELYPDGAIVADDNEAAGYLATILASYKSDEPVQFNQAVREYQSKLPKLVPAGTPLGKVGMEYRYNALSPFYTATILYLLAALICPLSWVFTSGAWRRAVFSVIVIALVVHTIGLVARIWISGRPPVTNLYSSAIFIGWISVILFLVIERITKVSVGNVLASVVGFITLLLAYNLGTQDDTFKVMQAVLDTQFWLATHVVCITVGYGTTFVAGMLAFAYIIGGVFVPPFNRKIKKIFSNLIYGTICFSLLFSFVGTVLGGLWADDSWGRFWGWDPKENGALIIVIWNALVLHARWGAMIKERGLAVLAIFGNVVTAWSWFGTNQLGFGLHSYGFTEGVLYTLGGWVLLNLIFMGVGMIPTHWWRSEAKRTEVA